MRKKIADASCDHSHTWVKTFKIPNLVSIMLITNEFWTDFIEMHSCFHKQLRSEHSKPWIGAKSPQVQLKFKLIWGKVQHPEINFGGANAVYDKSVQNLLEITIELKESRV